MPDFKWNSRIQTGVKEAAPEICKQYLAAIMIQNWTSQACLNKRGKHRRECGILQMVNVQRYKAYQLCILQLQSSLQDSRGDTKDNALDYLKAIHKILESLYEKFDEPVNAAWLMFNFYKFCTVMTEMLYNPPTHPQKNQEDQPDKPPH